MEYEINNTVTLFIEQINDNTYITLSLDGSQLNTVSPLTPPAQPIQFDTLEKALLFLNERNVDSYSHTDMEKEKYLNMIDTIMDKYVPCIESDKYTIKDEVILLPGGKYEDVSIMYRVNDFSILFSFLNKEIEDIHDIDKYYPYIKDYTLINHGSLTFLKWTKESSVRYYWYNEDGIIITVSASGDIDIIDLIENITFKHF